MRSPVGRDVGPTPRGGGSTRFRVPDDRHADAPPEHRGLARDEIRLVVASATGTVTTTFDTLPTHLSAGDLVVVNTSATVPAAVDGWLGARPVVLHLSTPLVAAETTTSHGTAAAAAAAATQRWVVELRRLDGTGPVLDAAPGDVVLVAGGASATLRAPRARAGDGVRLWDADVRSPGHVEGALAFLARHGRPIRYGHLDVEPTLDEVQPDVARHPGSAEMASAGRPLTPAVITDLVTSGITVAPVTLHAGVSSQSAGEPPQPEHFSVPSATARLVEHTRRHGGHIVAVGTTVVRALESAVDEHGTVRAAAGRTDRVVTVEDPPTVVTGLITGWHAPDSSHVLLLEAIAGRDLVATATTAAIAGRLLWHEFGDSCLYLP